MVAGVVQTILDKPAEQGSVVLTLKILAMAENHTLGGESCGADVGTGVYIKYYSHVIGC